MAEIRFDTAIPPVAISHRRPEERWSGALPYLLLLLTLCISSAVMAIAHPLSFVEIFSRL
jgi:hypothetical protein